MASREINFVKFSHSCVRTPLHPKSKTPMPLYERKKRDENGGEEEVDDAAVDEDDEDGSGYVEDGTEGDDEGTLTPPPQKQDGAGTLTTPTHKPEDSRYT